MATLTRPTRSQEVENRPQPRLQTAIPKPFPSNAERQQLLQQDLLDELGAENLDLEDNLASQPGPSRLVDEENGDSSDTAHDNVMPSIAYVQKSCLMTLNNLLASQGKWNPIVPDRRHSVPSTPQSSSAPTAAVSEATPALQTLLSNLRNQTDSNEMTELQPSADDTELIDELRVRIDDLASSLQPTDAHLAQAVVSLLSNFNRIQVILSKTRSRNSIQGSTSWNPNDQPIPPADVFAALRQQLSEFQVERQTQGDTVPKPGSPPVLAVETALLWTQIDDELETVLGLCRERTESLPRDHLPPQYDLDDYGYDDALPEYEYGGRASIDSNDTKGRHSIHSLTSPTSGNEKMRLDLEAVTMAIDRLYLVAPQLHNQRVELKTSKLEAMEKARTQAGKENEKGVKEGKQRERELDSIIEMIGRASDRKIDGQSVVLEGGMKSRMERAKQREQAKRDAFVEQLAKHSDAGRFHSQDAVLHPPRSKDPNTPITVREFLRESVPDSEKENDSEALLSLPEFVREPIPDNVPVKTSTSRLKKQSSRSRSMSAPSLNWLRPSSSRGSSSGLDTLAESTESTKPKKKVKSRPGSSKAEMVQNTALDVRYVAEHHESLNHVLVFMTIADVTPGADVKAEVVPLLTNSAEGDHLIVRCGAGVSAELELPMRTSPGPKEVKSSGAHFELKLTTSPVDAQIWDQEPVPLLDATQLSTSNPTSFICSSCSLPLVQSSKISSYKDLPSEHWEELVDAWMCHTDQNLHDQVAKHSRGFWPSAGQALIGGSYILFEESSVVKSNLHPTEQPKRGEDWRMVRCICGAITGRCQDHHQEAGESSTVYRLVKYAIRPVTPNADPSRVPLSAFIVEDMTEFVQAHASYRFVISDEEDERPRLLIWLFKPNLRLSYASPRQFALPKSGSIRAAKVLFKVLGPSTASTDMKEILNKYPGFPQAEYLFYPFNICKHLAALLKESNQSYPESLRTMTGLDVGWLHRA